ncbi:PAAR-like protein [Lacrimispora brassicae]
MSTFNTIGDFIWASDNKKNEEKEQQEQYLELMYMHQQYNGILSKQQYALRGSKLSCSYGTDYSLLDASQDHGIYKENSPVMTTIDSGKSNIYHFGSCLCPESNYKGRLPMTVGTLKNGKKAKKASYNNYAHICVPMVPEGSAWKQVDHSIMAKTCAEGYAPLLLDSAMLVCQYGGLIRIVEVPQTGTTKGAGQIADKYFANERLKIRATPNGQQIDGDRVFIPGAIVKVHESKETQKVEDSDSTWIKVYYDVSKVCWVGKEVLKELPQPVTGHNFKYNWDKSQYVTQDFKNKAAGVAKSLGIDPDDLMAVMAFESYGCNPSQTNMAGGSATGLVQFMPDTAKDLHTTTAELAKMSGVEQLDYVFGYFYPYKGRLITLSDIYMRVLAPSNIGKGENDAVYTKGSEKYEANKGLDANGDGTITKKEATQKVIDERNKYIN